MSRITSDQLAQDFINRGLTADKGRLLTVKQAKWLFDITRQEIEASGIHCPLRARNGAPMVSGMGWTLYINRNGTGVLKEA